MTTADTTTAVGLDTSMLKAISHPVRLDTLWILGEREASATEVSDQLGVPLGVVCHHMDVLKKLDKIELVREERGGGRRGGTENYYRAIDKAHVSNAISDLLPIATRNEISGTILKEILRLIGEALKGRTFDSKTDRHLSWVPFELDDQGWSELVALKAKQLDDEMELRARAAERLALAGESGKRFVAVDAAFEVPPGAIS